jgi:hypothetical protein
MYNYVFLYAVCKHSEENFTKNQENVHFQTFFLKKCDKKSTFLISGITRPTTDYYFSHITFIVDLCF